MSQYTNFPHPAVYVRNRLHNTNTVIEFKPYDVAVHIEMVPWEFDAGTEYTASWDDGSTELTVVEDIDAVAEGMAVSGDGIPDGAVVVSKDAQVVTISLATTAAGAAATVTIDTPTNSQGEGDQVTYTRYHPGDVNGDSIIVRETTLTEEGTVDHSVTITRTEVAVGAWADRRTLDYEPIHGSDYCNTAA